MLHAKKLLEDYCRSFQCTRKGNFLFSFVEDSQEKKKMKVEKKIGERVEFSSNDKLNIFIQYFIALKNG